MELNPVTEVWFDLRYLLVAWLHRARQSWIALWKQWFKGPVYELLPYYGRKLTDIRKYVSTVLFMLPQIQKLWLQSSPRMDKLKCGSTGNLSHCFCFSWSYMESRGSTCNMQPHQEMPLKPPMVVLHRTWKVKFPSLWCFHGRLYTAQPTAD